jgi:hypothetical protein
MFASNYAYALCVIVHTHMRVCVLQTWKTVEKLVKRNTASKCAFVVLFGTGTIFAVVNKASKEKEHSHTAAQRPGITPFETDVAKVLGSHINKHG